jgi:hypothetical protein
MAQPNTGEIEKTLASSRFLPRTDITAFERLYEERMARMGRGVGGELKEG